VIVSFVDETDADVSAFLRQFHVPILSMSSETSRQAVGRAQIAYLAERGHRRIVFAAPERRDVQWLAQARLNGVREGCAERALEPPIVQVVPSSRASAQEAIVHLLAKQSPPFGVCCYNDEVAFAVLAACSDAGIQVPEVVAVIGCDDIPLAQFSIPSLTTITFDDSQWLTILTENILAASRGESLQEALPKPFSIIVRTSA
jgi:DNA-binding LacI/PurR family transcriptional regulator